MKDVQNSNDIRGIDLDQVGVNNLKYPIIVLDKKNKKQHTVANVSMSVNLPHHFKGTHMSRFIEILNHCRGEITMNTLPAILHELKSRLDAESAHIELTFPYFIEKTAPVSKAKALMDYDCTFIAETVKNNDDFILIVAIPVTSLCPCSKEISDYGAHNQRGYVEIQLKNTLNEKNKPNFVWIEEVIDIVESSASAPVYALLKRSDERYVTMQAHDNPVFVEDIVRNIALKLKKHPKIAWFKIHAENHESIHNHNAFAKVEWSR